MEVGTKVIIVNNLEELMNKEDYDIVDEMLEYAGKEATITRSHHNTEEHELDIDDGFWYWKGVLLKPIEKDITDEF